MEKHAAIRHYRPRHLSRIRRDFCRYMRQLIALCLTLSILIGNLSFYGSAFRADAADSIQINQNLADVNQWSGNGCNASGGAIVYTAGGSTPKTANAAASVICTDPNLLAALQAGHAPLKISVTGSCALTAGTVQVSAGEYAGADLGVAMSAAPLAQDSKTLSDSMDFTLEGTGTLPADTQALYLEIAFAASDDAAGSVSISSVWVSVDDTVAPAFSAAYSTTEWTKDDVQITLTAADDGLGLAGIYNSEGQRIDSASPGSYAFFAKQNATYSFTARDYAGNSAPLTVSVANIDKTVPASPAAPSVSPAGDAWTHTAPTITFAALTTDSGSPLHYAVAEGTQPYTPFTGVSYTCTAAGEHTYSFITADAAGNESAAKQTVTVRYDPDAPQCDEPEIVQENGSTTVRLTVTDALSGVAAIKYASGQQTAEYFTQNASAGTDITQTKQFTVQSSDSYTVFLQDTAGNTAVKTIQAKVKPTIGALEDTTVAEDAAQFTLAADISDDKTAAGDLQLQVQCSDSALFDTTKGGVLTAAMQQGQAVLTLKSAADANTGTGAASITLTVTDADGLAAEKTFSLTVSPVNDAPVAQDDAPAAILEGESCTIAAVENDTDVDNENSDLSIASFTQPAHGTVHLSQDSRSLIYTPNTKWYGTDTFTYLATDGITPGTSPATVTVLVTNAPDAPIAVADTAAGKEDTPLDIDVLQNDTDADQLPGGESVLTVTLPDSNGPIHGSAAVLENSKIRYTPDANWYGTDTFSYTVTDKDHGNQSATAAVTVTIEAVNDAPVISACPDSLTADEDSQNNSFTFTVSDEETDAAELMVQVTSGNEAKLRPDAITCVRDETNLALYHVTYSPAKDQFGAASLILTVSDGTASAEGSILITVTAVDDAPTLAADSNNVNTCLEDAQNCSLTFLCSDSDTAFNALTFTVESLTPKLIQQDAFTVAKDAAAGTFTVSFSPIANANGTAQLKFTVSDGTTAQTLPLDYNITPVPDAPVAHDDAYTVPAGQSVYLIPLENDTDADDDALTLVGSPTTPTNGGSITPISGDSKGFYYTAPDAAGSTDTFTYTVQDPAGTQATATVTITIVASNAQAPVLDGLSSIGSAMAGKAKTFPFTVRCAAGLSSVTMQCDDAELIPGEISCQQTAADTQNGVYTYSASFTPAAGHYGTAYLHFTAVSAGPDALQTQRSVAVPVRATNTAPTAPTITLPDGTEDTSYVFHASDLIGTGKCTDADGDTLTITRVYLPSAISSDYITRSGDTFTYTPAANKNGSVSFTYLVSDGIATAQGTLTLSLAPVNDRPWSYGIWRTLPNQTGAETTTFDVAANLIASGHDAENDTLYFVGLENDATHAPLYGTVSYDAQKGTVTYTRNQIAPSAHGSDTFYFYLADCDPSDLGYTIAANRSNLIAVHIYEDYPHFSTSNQTDSCQEDSIGVDISIPIGLADGYTGTFVLEEISSATPKKGSVSLTENSLTTGPFLLHYTPDPDAYGSDSFQYTIRNTQDSAETTVTVSVYIYPVNDAPTLEVTPQGSLPPATGEDWACEEDNAQVFSLSYGDIDNAAADLTLRVTVENEEGQTVAENTAACLKIVNDTAQKKATVTLTPLANAAGKLKVHFSLSDGLAVTEKTLSGTVQAVDDAPTAADAALNTQEDTQVSVEMADFVQDVDSPAANFAYSIVTQGQKGTASFTGSVLSYMPRFNESGTDTVTYQVESNGKTAQGTLTVSIAPVNDAPYLYDYSSTVIAKEDEPFTFAFHAFDYEDDASAEDDDVVKYTFASDNPTLLPVENIQLSENGKSKTLTLTPAKDAFGTVKITITATDSEGLTATASFTATVSPVNDAPIFQASGLAPNTLELNATEDQTLSFAPLEYVTDAEDAPTLDSDKALLSVSAISPCAQGGSVQNKNGQLVYLSALHFSGEDSFTYTILDKDGGTTDVAVTVHVASVNYPPAAQADTAQTDEGKSVRIPVLANDTVTDAYGAAADGTVAVTVSSMPDTPTAGAIDDTFGEAAAGSEHTYDLATLTDDADLHDAHSSEHLSFALTGEPAGAQLQGSVLHYAAAPPLEWGGGLRLYCHGYAGQFHPGQRCAAY